jgi:hypothetical protein
MMRSMQSIKAHHLKEELFTFEGRDFRPDMAVFLSAVVRRGFTLKLKECEYVKEALDSYWFVSIWKTSTWPGGDYDERFRAIVKIGWEFARLGADAFVEKYCTSDPRPPVDLERPKAIEYLLDEENRAGPELPLKR